MAKTARGFSVIEVVVVALVVLLAGFGGWYVWQRGHKNEPSVHTSSNSNEKVSSPTVKATYKAPDGYVVYENKDIGFKFAYPKEWGTIVRTGDDTPSLITDGLNGHALRTVFENSDVNALPRGNYLSGDTSVGTDEGHYGGGYIQKGDKYYSIAKYTAEEVEIPSERIMAKVKSGLGTVLVINAGTIAGDRIQLLLNLPGGKPLTGLDLVFKNSNEDFADESVINNAGLETIKSVAQTFEQL
ncbi:MAG TPA: hypothetical protein VLH86_05700 [Patescibacteria group bacterium]|nr:hypothetical protein [Patescibacteria group bacterium]